MMYIGVVKLPSISECWERIKIFHYEPIASIITMDHFFELQRYHHFADNSNL